MGWEYVLFRLNNTVIVREIVTLRRLRESLHKFIDPNLKPKITEIELIFEY